MGQYDPLISQWQAERDELQRLMSAMEAGTLRMAESVNGSGWQEVTNERIARHREQIEMLDAILEEYRKING